MTVLANLLSVTPTEMIERALPAKIPIPIALALAWAAAVGKGSGNNIQIPRWLAPTVPAGTKAENDEFPLAEMDSDHENISGGWVGYSDLVSSEADMHTVENVLAAVIRTGERMIRNRVDVDGLAMLAFADNDEDNTGNALTDDMVLDALALYDTLNINETASGRGLPLTPGMHRAWVDDLKTNGGDHLGGDAESERIAAFFGARMGFIGVRHGVQLFKSNNLSLTGADANTAILPLGEGGPLAYRVWSPVMWEEEWMPRRKAWEITLSANYAWGLADPGNLVGLIALA
jgi:hypothetical protein